MALKGTINITLNGEAHPLFLGVNATALYCDLRGVNLPEFYKDLITVATGGANPSITRDLIFVGIADGYRKDGKTLPENFNKYTVGDHMDDMSKEDVLKFLEALANCLPKSTEEDEEVKKKTKPKKVKK